MCDRDINFLDSSQSMKPSYPRSFLPWPPTPSSPSTSRASWSNEVRSAAVLAPLLRPSLPGHPAQMAFSVILLSGLTSLDLWLTSTVSGIQSLLANTAYFGDRAAKRRWRAILTIGLMSPLALMRIWKQFRQILEYSRY